MRTAPLLAAALLCAPACSEYDLTPDREAPETPIPGEPVADAGEDIYTVPLTDVRLDGTASFDPDDLQITAYEWTVLRIPEGSTATLDDPTDPQPWFFADIAGEYEFALTVQNARGEWDSTPDRVLVDAEPDEGFYVQLTWDAEVDLDLHVLDGDTPLFEIPGDACYCNTNPDWGVTGNSADNPSLDNDEINGFGPETTTIQIPAPGRYPVKVHYYGQFGAPTCEDVPCPATTATVRFFVDGVEKQVFTGVLDNQGEVWHVGAIDWPSQEILPDGHMGRTEETTCY